MGSRHSLARPLSDSSLPPCSSLRSVPSSHHPLRRCSKPVSTPSSSLPTMPFMSTTPPTMTTIPAVRSPSARTPHGPRRRVPASRLPYATRRHGPPHPFGPVRPSACASRSPVHRPSTPSLAPTSPQRGPSATFPVFPKSQRNPYLRRRRGLAVTRFTINTPSATRITHHQVANTSHSAVTNMSLTPTRSTSPNPALFICLSWIVLSLRSASRPHRPVHTVRLAALAGGAVHVRVVRAGFASSSLPVMPFLFTMPPTITAMSAPTRRRRRRQRQSTCR